MKKNKFSIRNQLELQAMVWPALIVLIIFAYIPMYGVQIAFKDFQIGLGIYNSPWVGFKYFEQFLTDPNLFNVLKNTLILNVFGALITFPAPIILALLINELSNGVFKKTAQTVSYMPHFLSWVIFGGLIMQMLRADGIISDLAVMIGIFDEPVNFMAQDEWFYGIFITSSLIKGLGFGSIIYVAALSGVDQETIEAAAVDGCNRLQKIWHISLPAILGTVVIMLIFAISSILNTGIENVLMFQNSLNLQTSEVLDTYVYKVGVSQQRFSYSTAVGLLKSLVGIILLIGANFFSKKITEKGLF